MKLLFVGDVMLGRMVNNFLSQRQDFAYPWGDTLDIFQSADFRFCNLECVISDKGQPWRRTPKKFIFRADAKNIVALKKADINLVSLANNHVFDQEEEGFLDMIARLEKNNIAYAGAGRNIFDAESPVLLEVDGLKIALSAVTDNEPQWEADTERPGINYFPLDASDGRVLHLVDHIEKIRGDVDLIMVSLHWGPNWGYDVPEEHRVFARHLIDSGVDIVLGHSPHIFRGIEIYKKRPIFYSLGDFIDDYAVDASERNDQSFIFVLEIQNKIPIKAVLYPTLIRNFQATSAAGHDAEAITTKMTELCADFDTKFDRYLSEDNALTIHIQ